MGVVDGSEKAGAWWPAQKFRFQAKVQLVRIRLHLFLKRKNRIWKRLFQKTAVKDTFRMRWAYKCINTNWSFNKNIRFWDPDYRCTAVFLEGTERENLGLPTHLPQILTVFSHTHTSIPLEQSISAQSWLTEQTWKSLKRPWTLA